MPLEIALRATFIIGTRFDVATASGHHLTLDTSNQNTESNTGPSPMEMLLASLAGCSGISMLSLLHKRRSNITNYEISVHGKQSERHPHVFLEIYVEHFLTGHSLQETEVQRALQLTEERYCSVSVMLSKTTTLIQTFHIIEAPE